ncbi:MAG: helix-turn-helix transcriptional regulator [Maritimibacter sp.]
MSRRGKGAVRARRDRLTKLMATLRQSGPHRARDLAQSLGVTQRTIWRDIDALRDSGIEISGTRGRGYELLAPITLPPLNLTLGEVEALHLALAVLGEATDPALAQAAGALADKIDASLPENGAAPGVGFALHPFAEASAGHSHVPLLRDALRGHKRLRLTTQTEGEPRTRLMRPLSLTYLGRVWVLRAWCEDSETLCTLPVDHILKVIDTGATFTPALAP